VGGSKRRVPDTPDSGVLDIYRDLLSEAASPTSAPSADEDRPLKRRRKHEDATTEENSPLHHRDSSLISSSKRPTIQTVIDESEGSDETELEWEEVDVVRQEDVKTPHAGPQGINVVLEGSPRSTTKRRMNTRKGTTAAERKVRLDIHKVYLLCLLVHVHIRNAWCNDTKAQVRLKKLLPSRFMPYLQPKAEFSQFERARSFMEGLTQLCDFWNTRFHINAMGARKPKWIATGEDIAAFKLGEDAEPLMDRTDFRKAAMTLEGSPDVGAQLLCALLRSVGVKARLVCSLQPLPYAATVNTSTPQKSASGRKTIRADASEEEHEHPSLSTAKYGPAKAGSATGFGSLAAEPPKRIARLGQSRKGSSAPVDLGRPPPVRKIKKTPRPRYPVYWVEAFNEAHQKWVPVDAVATTTVNKPAKLEPPMSDSVNAMSYVIAFEEDGVAKDVTRRYTKAYNAKTRKLRVETTEGGQRWLKKAMKVFRRGVTLDRDQVEDAELAQKESQEEMPRNVQDFKDHPHYALERHLRYNEVIHPKREVGKVNAGTSASTRLESIFRRRDVHIVRSADKWYRFGREVKAGEQPMKHAKPRRHGERDSLAETTDIDAEDVRTALYAGFQTELYVPPPVVGGRIPKNTYGNLDVYTPSMIPEGAIHLTLPGAAKAARLLGVDYADAVIGFKFQGRHGTAVTQGIVVAYEYKEAIESVDDGIKSMQEEDVEAKRSLEALRLWRRFLIGLKIVARVKGYDDDEPIQDVQEDLDEEEKQVTVEAAAGGFLPSDADIVVPTARGSNASDAGILLRDSGFLNGFQSRDHVASRDETTLGRSRDIEGNETDEGEEEEDPNQFGGGFLPESAVAAQNSTKPTLYLEQSPRDDAVRGGFVRETAYDNQMPDASESSPSHLEDILSSNEPKAVAKATSSQLTTHRAQSLTQTKQGQHGMSDGDVVSLSARDSEEERGSLASHDPEDDDAEPEWLAS